MVALCRTHHDAADQGAYTTEQFREMKAFGRDRAQVLAGRFEWRRLRLLAVVGGSFFYETPIAVQIRDQPVVWFNRDEEDHLLLNVAMPSTIPEPRLRIEDNFWIQIGDPVNLECPPSGRLVSVDYRNGDLVRVEFFEVEDGEALSKRSAYADNPRRLLEDEEPDGFPVTVVEIRMRVMAPVLDFDAQETRIGGLTMKGTLIARGNVGFSLG